VKAFVRYVLSIIELISLYLFGRRTFLVRTKQQDIYWQQRLEEDFKNNSELHNHDPYYRRFDEEIRTLLGNEPDALDYLEIGCYYGFRVNMLAMSFPEKKFMGTDLNANNIAFGIKHLHVAENLRLLAADAMALPFRDNSYDVVYTVVSVSHMSHDIAQRALQEMARVSRKTVILVEIDLFDWPVKKQLSVVRVNYMFFHDYLSLAPPSLEIQKVIRLYCGEAVYRYSVFVFSKRV